MTFFRWFKIGLLCSIFSGAVVISGILLLNKFMPDREANVKFAHLSEKAGKVFGNKAAKIEGRLIVSGKDLKLAAPKGDSTVKAICADGLAFEDVAKFAGKAVVISGTLNTEKCEAGKFTHTLTIKQIAEATEDKK